jgi:hypothetical protein
MIDYNHLDLIGERELTFIPPHFTRTALSDRDEWNKNSFESWIKNKLHGRYCITKMPVIENEKLKSSLIVAFEDHSEMTYFMLACPHLRRNP